MARVVQVDRRPEVNRTVIEGFVIPNLTPETIPRRLHLALLSRYGPEVGSHIVIRAVVRPAGSPVVPDGFQFRRLLYFNGIGGTVYSLGNGAVRKKIEFMAGVNCLELGSSGFDGKWGIGSLNSFLGRVER